MYLQARADLKAIKAMALKISKRWIHPNWETPEFRDKVFWMLFGMFLFMCAWKSVSDTYFVGLNLRKDSCIEGGRLMIVERSGIGSIEGLKRMDVAAFRNEVFIKTYGPKTIGAKYVAALPGDTVEVKAGRVSINGKSWGTLDLVGKKQVPLPVARYDARYTVPRGKVLMLGSKNNSYDGRYWGLVDQSEIVGKAHVIF
jgi:signal peptidase I